MHDMGNKLLKNHIILVVQMRMIQQKKDAVDFLIFDYKEKAQIILNFIYPREYFRPPARIKHS